MVGFARAVSDGVAIAYLADVYVLPEARGRGLGKELVRTMIDRGPGARLRWALHTSDAHGLYRQFGFAPPTGMYLERPYGLPGDEAADDLEPREGLPPSGRKPALRREPRGRSGDECRV
jgi:GNAT superfamily N-acetyltransferase